MEHGKPSRSAIRARQIAASALLVAALSVPARAQNSPIIEVADGIRVSRINVADDLDAYRLCFDLLPNTTGEYDLNLGISLDTGKTFTYTSSSWQGVAAGLDRCLRWDIGKEFPTKKLIVAQARFRVRVFRITGALVIRNRWLDRQKSVYPKLSGPIVWDILTPTGEFVTRISSENGFDGRSGPLPAGVVVVRQASIVGWRPEYETKVVTVPPRQSVVLDWNTIRVNNPTSWRPFIAFASGIAIGLVAAIELTH
jgi:hypothetical protein